MVARLGVAGAGGLSERSRVLANSPASVTILLRYESMPTKRSRMPPPVGFPIWPYPVRRRPPTRLAVVGREHPGRDPAHGVLALVARRLVVVLAVVNADLRVHEVLLPGAVDAQPEVGRGHVPASLQRHLPLHAVVPERLFPVQPRRVDLAELEGDRAVLGGERGVGVLEAVREGAVGVPVDVGRDAGPEAARELADHVHVRPAHVEVVDVIRRVLELIEILRVHHAADGDGGRGRRRPLGGRGTDADERTQNAEQSGQLDSGTHLHLEVECVRCTARAFTRRAHAPLGGGRARGGSLCRRVNSRGPVTTCRRVCNRVVNRPSGEFLRNRSGQRGSRGACSSLAAYFSARRYRAMTSSASPRRLAG